MSKPLEVSVVSETEIRLVRAFDAPADLVFRAWFEPALLRRWLLGPPGWTMAACEIDGRVGGAYRYVWRHDDGRTMGMGGVFTEIDRPNRWAATERFDEAWYEGEGVNLSELTESDGRTTHVMTLRYETKAARDTALQSGMTDGMEAGFQRLDALFAEEAAA